MCMQDLKRCPVESASPVHESSPQNTLGCIKVTCKIVSSHNNAIKAYM